MIVSRLASVFLRLGELFSAAVVLGLVSWFLHVREKYGGPLGREIYTVVIAALSVVLALVWLIPTTGTMLHYPFDLFMAAAWFAAFGVLVNYIHGARCGSAWDWSQMYYGWHGYGCGKWKAAEAFSFISACFWLASFLLGVYVYHRLSDRRAPATRSRV